MSEKTNSSLRKKIGKKVWFIGELWEVIDFLSPTKYDHYILVQRIRNDQVHPGGGINPINMRLIDIHEDVFYPDTREVRSLISLIGDASKKNRSINETLSNIWLKTVSKNTH